MKDIPRWLLVTVSLLVLVLITWYFSKIVAYVLVAGLLSILGQPLVELILKIKIKGISPPRSIASLAAMFIMFITVILFISIFIPMISSEAKVIASIDLKEVATSLQGPVQAVEDWFQRLGLQESGVSLSAEIQRRLRELVNVTNVSNVINNVLGITGNLFIAFFSISFILFFFLKDKNLFYNILMALSPSDDERTMEKALSGIKNLLTRYFIGIIIQISIIITVISIGLSIIGLSNSILIGFFAGIFNVIPYIGPLIGATLGIVLGITSAFPIEFYPDMVWLMAKILIVFAIAQMLDNFVLQPLIFSNSVKAHPLEIFLVILAAGSVAGVGGMIIAIPAYTVFRVIAKEFLGEFRLIKKLTQDM